MMAVWGFLGLLFFCFVLNQVFIKINWVKIHGIGIIKCRKVNL